jgi:hypothetical protein
MMNAISQTTIPDPLIRAAGAFSIVSAIVSAIGVVFLVAMFVLFGTQRETPGLTAGMLNDICVALQYLLTIPIALALYRILAPYNPRLMGIATAIGIGMMVVVVVLQMLLVFGAMAFEKQVVWVSLAMILGVGSWLVITGLVAKSTGRLPNSVLMSAAAVPYVGYPVWAFWLGKRLLGW